MKYLCLAYEEEKKLNALSQSEWDALRSETLAYVEALRKSGHWIVDARGLNEAFQVASRWPSARLGSIEVRPIEEELRQDRRYG
jgi:hypothetical protein